MSMIQSIGRIEFGVRFVVCSNAEVIGLQTVGQDQTGNGWEDEAREASSAACRVLDEAGFFCDTESSFRAYNGGVRRSLVDAVYYVAEIDEDGIRGAWRVERESNIPENERVRAEAVAEKAIAALVKVMEDASKEQETTNAD
jgi:hypothetical protein